MKTYFYLIRHGQSIGNAWHRYLGHTDLGLSDLGKIQAEEAGAALADKKIDFIYSSDLKRAHETAIPHAKRRGLDIIDSKDLREMFVEFINNKGLDKFKRQFKNSGTEVFVSQNYTEGTFYSYMMSKIVETATKGVVPVLVHTGVIYKMGFSNQNIMEDPNVMKFQKPLVFFYPAMLRNDTIYFLDKQPASKYRCVVVI